MTSTFRALSEEEVAVICSGYVTEREVCARKTQDAGWIVPLLNDFSMLFVLYPTGQVCTPCCPHRMPFIPACGLLSSPCRSGLYTAFSTLSPSIPVHNLLSSTCRLGVHSGPFSTLHAVHSCEVSPLLHPAQGHT